jgi:DNA-binding transcriptional MerR regulator
MWNVTELARRCGLSRSTLLYYEKLGLLGRARRSAANYRCYTEADLARLNQICVYRNAGLKLADIGVLLKRRDGDAVAVLKRRMAEIDREVEHLREHQRNILKLLQIQALGRDPMLTKEKFVAVLKGAGFTEEQMRRWHQEFEKRAPAEHQEFLEFLHIPAAEITEIRAASRKAK